MNVQKILAIHRPADARMNLPLLVGQEFIAHDDLDAIALRIFFLDVNREIDRAHNTVTKLFMHHAFNRHPIDLHNLVVC